MSVVIKLTVFVILIGITLKLNPELVLKVPKIGFVLYHLVANAPIPPYIVQDHWKDDSTWLKSGDVVVSIVTKGGTTWAMHTVHLLRTKGVVDYENILDVVPWVDFVRYPGEKLEERIKFFNRSQSGMPFAVYKSHSSPTDGLKFRNDVKYVVGVRDFIDTASSLRPFFSQHTAEFSSLWGGFPPRSQTDEEYENFHLKDKGDGYPYMDVGFWYVRGWWPYRKEPNVLFLHYQDRKNAAGDIDRLDAFLQTNLTQKEKEKVINFSNFRYMKANSNKFAYCQSHKADSVQQLHHVLDKTLCPIESDGFFDKGLQRVGREELRPFIVDEMSKRCLLLLGPQICQWLQTGGVIPDVELPELTV